MLKSLLRKFLGATAIVAMAGAFMPAHAAGVGCSGEDQANAESKVEGMADSPAKFAAQRHIAAAQDALLKDRMHDCAMHLSMAMQAASVPQQAPYAGAAAYAGPGPYAGPAPYAGTMAEAPYEGPYTGPAPYAGPAPYTDTMAEAPYGGPYGAPYRDTTAEGPYGTPY
jgi:hypothetical protein